MPKYRVTIEFETDRVLTFPHDAMLLENMQVQTESLEDGDIADNYMVTALPSKIEQVLPDNTTIHYCNTVEDEEEDI